MFIKKALNVKENAFDVLKI